jgi:hypothetical protein
VTVSTPPGPNRRRAWINVALAAWLVIGIALVARLNVLGIVPQSQRSIYVLPAYAGLAAGGLRGRLDRHGGPPSPTVAVALRRRLRAAPARLRHARRLHGGPGLGRLVRGEVGIAESLAPARLFLAVGVALVAVGPVRAVLRRAAGSSRPAAAIALGLTLGIATFPVGPVHPLQGAYATRPSDAIEDDSEIWVMAADGSGQTRVIKAGDGTEVSLPVWSPDGRSLAFSRWQDDAGGGVQADVWVADADGRNGREVAAGPGNDWIPAWSPDGQWIAYTADAAPQDRPPAGPSATSRNRAVHPVRARTQRGCGLGRPPRRHRPPPAADVGGGAAAI